MVTAVDPHFGSSKAVVWFSVDFVWVWGFGLGFGGDFFFSCLFF